MNPKDVAAIATARATRELAQRIARDRRREALAPLDMSVAGNARITVTALGRTGKPSRSAVAVALRKVAR